MKRLIRRLKYGRFTAATFQMIDDKSWGEDHEALCRTLCEIVNKPETCDVLPIRMTVPLP